MRYRLVAVFALLFAVAVPVWAQGSRASNAHSGKPAKAAVQKETAELRAVGGLGAGNLYTTFIAVGAIRDNFVSGTYDAKKATDLVQSISGLMAASIEQLQAVQKSPSVTAEDEEFIGGMIEIYATLRDEADSLVRYMESGSEADDGQFQKHREKAWEQISKLLGL